MNMKGMVARIAGRILMLVSLGLWGFHPNYLPAQSLNLALEGEVVMDRQDLDARSYFPVRDQNDELCALLKVKVTHQLQQPLLLETGAVGVEKREERENGEIWFWVPYQARNLRFSCFGYTELPPIAVRLEKGGVYRLTLRSDAQVQIVTNASASYNFLKLRILPEDAGNAFVSIGKSQEYEIDAQYASEGMYSKMLDHGTYYYQVEHELYGTVRGSVILDAATPMQTVTMPPAYGYLKIMTEPSGATVAINGKRVGTTPWTSQEKVPQGLVQVRLQASHHALMETSVEVLGNGQQQSHTFRLVPQFGTVTCQSEMADAEIWVDQQLMGVGSWTGPLSSQSSHILEARKVGHQSQSISFTVESGTSVVKTVGAPVPMFGTLVLETTPMGCEAWLDEVSLGTTPMVVQVLVGKHQLALKKNGYETKELVLEMGHNQHQEVKQELRKEVVQAASVPQTSIPDAKDETEKEDPIPYQLLEEKPSFQGGDANQFSKWVYSQLVYPSEARMNGVQGRVILKFIIETDGSVSEIRVLRSPDSSLSKEAVRLLSMSPKWEPGKMRGKPVRVEYTFSMIFQLR